MPVTISYLYINVLIDNDFRMVIFTGKTRLEQVCQENDVLERQRSAKPNWDAKNQKRYVERKIRGQTEIGNRDEAINYIGQTNKQMNTYKRSRIIETDTFISNDQ